MKSLRDFEMRSDADKEGAFAGAIYDATCLLLALNKSNEELAAAKDDRLLIEGMLQQSREHVKQEEAKTRKWQKMAEGLVEAASCARCSTLHHPSVDRHAYGMDCPVEERVREAVEEYYKLKEEYAK